MVKREYALARNIFDEAEGNFDLVMPQIVEPLDRGRGGNDTLTALDYSGTELIGDAENIFGTARGGNDHLSTEGGSNNTLYGDARHMDGSAHGGNDTLIINGGIGNIAYGDASSMALTTKGGNDTLIITGDTDGNTLYGDAMIMLDQSEGGNDDLCGGDGNDVLYGDAAVMGENTTGGNDMINGGGGNDDMWGGTGNDEFVFDPNSGVDIIHDLVVGEDEINLINYFSEGTDPDYQVEQVGDDTLITLLDGDSITLLNVNAAELEASDSILV